MDIDAENQRIVGDVQAILNENEFQENSFQENIMDDQAIPDATSSEKDYNKGAIQNKYKYLRNVADIPAIQNYKNNIATDTNKQTSLEENKQQSQENAVYSKAIPDQQNPTNDDDYQSIDDGQNNLGYVADDQEQLQNMSNGEC